MVEVYVASAFSIHQQGGNYAGVVLQSRDLTKKEKIGLASKLGYSETVFLSPSGAADYKFEYFTPAEEVPLCGHATIAAFATLNALGLLDRSNYTIETKAGILKISIDGDGLIFMEQNNPSFYEVLDDSIVKKCFGGAAASQKLPIQIVSTGLRDILVPIESLAQLQALCPDFDSICELSKNKNVVGIHAFSLVNESSLTAVCRNFAPLYGIPEESATGTSCCALACFLFQHGIKQTEFFFEQGYNLGAVSRITVRLETSGGRIINAFVGGHGHLVCRKTLAF